MRLNKSAILTLVAGIVVVMIALLIWLRYTPLWYRLPDEATIGELVKIASTLSKKRFDIGRIENTSIVLYSAVHDGSIVNYREIERLNLQTILDRDKPSRTIYIIERSKSTMSFTLGGSVDDQWGVLYNPDECVRFNNVANLSIILGHPGWYVFDTTVRK